MVSQSEHICSVFLEQCRIFNFSNCVSEIELIVRLYLNVIGSTRISLILTRIMHNLSVCVHVFRVFCRSILNQPNSFILSLYCLKFCRNILHSYVNRATKQLSPIQSSCFEMLVLMTCRERQIIIDFLMISLTDRNQNSSKYMGKLQCRLAMSAIAGDDIWRKIFPPIISFP